MIAFQTFCLVSYLQWFIKWHNWQDLEDWTGSNLNVLIYVDSTLNYSCHFILFGTLCNYMILLLFHSLLWGSNNQRHDNQGFKFFVQLRKLLTHMSSMAM
jgi:hypothetical protein